MEAAYPEYIRRVSALWKPGEEVKFFWPDNEQTAQIRILLIEAIKRSMIWEKALMEKARYYFFRHILDDVANCINPAWTYSSKQDMRLRNCAVLPMKFQKVIDNYINWEEHAEEIYSLFSLPNPYEPLMQLFEMGTGVLVDIDYEIEVYPLLRFSTRKLLSEIDLTP